MTFQQYLELVYLDKLYSRKEFISNLESILLDYFTLVNSHDDKYHLSSVHYGDACDAVDVFCDSRKMTPQELFEKFSKVIPVRMKNFIDLTGKEEALRYSDMDYPTIRAMAVTGRSWVVFISPLDGTLTYF